MKNKKNIKRAIAPTAMAAFFFMGLMPSNNGSSDSDMPETALAQIADPHFPSFGHKKEKRKTAKTKRQDNKKAQVTKPYQPTPIDTARVVALEKDTIKLTDQLIADNKYSSALDMVAKTCDIRHAANLAKLMANEPDIFEFMLSEGRAKGVPFTVWLRVLDRESGYMFIYNKQGSGAKGYCQVMPRTFAWYEKLLGLSGGHTKKNNITVGAKLLRDNADRYIKKGLDARTAWTRALKDYSGGNAKLAATEMAEYGKHGDELELYDLAVRLFSAGK